MRKLLLAAAACLAASAASAQTFTFTTLDNPGDPTFNQLLGINDNGIIVGYFGSGAAGHPNIGYQISPPYTKFAPNNQPGSVQTQATGINNAGLTTGFWSDTNLGGGDANFAFLRTPLAHGKFTYISAIDPATASAPRVSQALGINNSNVVAGFYADAAGTTHAYTYALATGTYTAFSPPGLATAMTGINDSGTTSGFATNAKQTTFGFVRSASGGVLTYFHVPQSFNTQLLGINNSGIAVGFYVDANNITHGLYYVASTGAWVKVDDPNGVGGTVVNGINNKNQLVGFYTDAAGNVHGMIVNVTP
jgi:hypothetical protein